MATEAVARAAFYPRLSAKLDAFPPKMVELHTDGSLEVDEKVDVATRTGAGPRIQHIVDQLQHARFTGNADRAVVQRMFHMFVVRLNVRLNIERRSVNVT